jgi:plastocyanin
MGPVLAVLAAAPARAEDHPVTFPVGSHPYFAYSSPDVAISPGDTVTFSGSFADHPLIWSSGTFPVTSSGSSATFAFSGAGEFAFHCQIHASMTGVVRVAGGGGDPGPPATGGGTGGDAGGGTTGGGDTSPGTSGGGEQTGPARDVTAPTVGRVPAALRFHGRRATLRIGADEPGRAAATLSSRGTVLARGEGSLRAGTAALRLRLTSRGAARLRRGGRMTARLVLVVRDADGNARTVRRAVRLRR